jgi:hypothetical protein
MKGKPMWSEILRRRLSLMLLGGVAFLLAASQWPNHADPAPGRAIGMAAVVVRDVTGHLQEIDRRLVDQDPVHFEEQLETALASATEVVFVDESKLSIGPGSLITLDAFVYDPGSGEEKFVLNAARGVLRFVSGNMQKSAYAIRTPLATVGVRGTKFTLVVGDGGLTNVTSEGGGDVIVYDCAGRRVELKQCGNSVTVAPTQGGCGFREGRPVQQPVEFALKVATMDTTFNPGKRPPAACTAAAATTASSAATASPAATAAPAPSATTAAAPPSDPTSDPPSNAPTGNRSGLGDGTNPGQGSANSAGNNQGGNNPGGGSSSGGSSSGGSSSGGSSSGGASSGGASSGGASSGGASSGGASSGGASSGGASSGGASGGGAG